MFDAAAADRIAVAVEELHREVGFLQPVVIGGFAKRGDRERQHQDQPAETDGGGFRKRLDEDPALPAADIEAVHEGGVALVQLAQALARREQRRVDARVQIQKEVPDLLLPVWRYDLAHRDLWSVRNARAPGRALSRRHALMLRQTQGAFRTLGDSQMIYPSGVINQ